MTYFEIIKAAGRARSDLNVFAAVKALMESSLVSSDCFGTKATIVHICNREIDRCLACADKEFAKLPRHEDEQA